MKIRTTLPEIIFFLFWLCFSSALTAIFAFGIHKEIHTKGASPWMYLVLILPVCFVLIGIWGLVTSVRKKLDPDGGIDRFQAKTEIPRGGRVGAFLFGLPFFLAGLCIMIFFSFVPTIQSLMAAKWERVPAEVTYSQIITNHDSDDGDTYKPDVRFRYSYDGYTYESKTYDFIRFSTSGYKSVRRKVDENPVGSRPLAYVNPKKPEEAVLSIRLSWFYLFTFLFGGIFAAVGGLIIFAVTFGKLDGKFAGKKQTDVPRSSGPEILKSRGGGSMTKFVTILIVAGIWNGIVYLLFVKDAPFIFKLIFGGFGLGLIAATWHAFLSLFNPRLDVEADTRHVRLGELLRLKWEIRGKQRTIKKFTIQLIGQEEATYRRGTDTYTDRNIFFTRTVAEQESGALQGQGTQTIAIPRDTMYSWQSSNNKIVWFVKFTGVIEKWPDVKEEYEINLLPLKGN